MDQLSPKLPECDTMQKGFWQTLDLLIRESKRTEKDVMDDVHEWVEKLVSNTKDQREGGEDGEKEKRSRGRKTEMKSLDDSDGDSERKSEEDLFDLPKIECK